MRRIVIKLGTSSLTNQDGTPNEAVAFRVAKEVQLLREREGIESVIVSSGAVGLGRKNMPADFKLQMTQGIHYDRQILHEQVLASIGQAELISTWTRAFRLGDGTPGCGQLLITGPDFADHDRYLSIKGVTENLLRAGQVPVFNNNDVLAPGKVNLGDNDQLAALVGAMVGAEKVILLTNVDGLLDGEPGADGSNVVSVVKDAAAVSMLVNDNLSTGKGGMMSKLATAELVTSLGMDLHIASGLTDGVVSDILAGKETGTFFPRRISKPTSEFKRWLATAAVSAGKIVVSTTLADLLQNQRSASVLLTGVESIEGNFPAASVVEIYNDEGVMLGKGRTKYSSLQIRRKLKNKTNRDTKMGGVANDEDIIHYNHLVFC